jgi:hypothetical protein
MRKNFFLKIRKSDFGRFQSPEVKGGVGGGKKK